LGSIEYYSIRIRLYFIYQLAALILLPFASASTIGNSEYEYERIEKFEILL